MFTICGHVADHVDSKSSTDFEQIRIQIEDQVDHVIQKYQQPICVCQTYLYIWSTQVTVKTNPRHNVKQGIIDSQIVSSDVKNFNGQFLPKT